MKGKLRTYIPVFLWYLKTDFKKILSIVVSSIKRYSSHHVDDYNHHACVLTIALPTLTLGKIIDFNNT